MKNIISAFLLLAMISCNSDRKKETISSYLKYIWRINSDNRFEVLSLEETGTIQGKDSLEILMKEYSKSENMANSDSVISNYEKDEIYNSNLLEKTKTKIDSFKKNNLAEYAKNLEDLRDFTVSQLRELRAEKYLLNKYKDEPDEILCRRILCRYKIRKEVPDTTSKTYTQIFYLSKDTRRVLAVKQDSSAVKKPSPK
jgi:hypothetical protein